MWRLPLCMLTDRPLLCRVANHKEKYMKKLKKCISNLQEFYKYLNKLQIFFFNIAMCSEIVFSLCTKLL